MERIKSEAEKQQKEAEERMKALMAEREQRRIASVSCTGSVNCAFELCCEYAATRYVFLRWTHTHCDSLRVLINTVVRFLVRMCNMQVLCTLECPCVYDSNDRVCVTRVS